jgi:hypothetical protein
MLPLDALACADAEPIVYAACLVLPGAAWPRRMFGLQFRKTHCLTDQSSQKVAKFYSRRMWLTG